MVVHTVVAGRPPVGVPQTEKIQWAAITSPQALKFNGTSKEEVARALVKMFGAFPIRLDVAQGHDEMLRAMAAAAGEGEAPYSMLLAGLKQFSSIELTEK